MNMCFRNESSAVCVGNYEGNNLKRFRFLKNSFMHRPLQIKKWIFTPLSLKEIIGEIFSDVTARFGSL